MRGATDGPHQPEIKINERLLLRLLRKQEEGKGPLDEVVCYDEYGNCEFHLEKMSDVSWWMRFYSTKGRPIPRELVVWLGPSGANLEFEEPYTHEDEKKNLGDGDERNQEIADEVGEFIRYYGMKRLLEEMISSTDKQKKEETDNWPNRDTSYLGKLSEDLGVALKNYVDRYNEDYGPGLGDDDEEEDA